MTRSWNRGTQGRDIFSDVGFQFPSTAGMYAGRLIGYPLLLVSDNKKNRRGVGRHERENVARLPGKREEEQDCLICTSWSRHGPDGLNGCLLCCNI